MPLSEEEWRAYINEYNGAMSDVEGDLSALFENAGHRLRGLADRGEVLSGAEAEAIWETIQEGLHKVQDRLNAHARRLLRMREAREL